MEFSTKFESIVRSLAITKKLKAGENKIFLLRRRAFRFMKLEFNCRVDLTCVSIKLRMTPSKQLGWFHCEEEIFNKMWETGKYTLHVNKHQEYESCPRNEMKFFSGDGVIDGLIDYYAFGDPSLTLSSLSLTEPLGSAGIIGDKFDRNQSLTDYPAW